MKATREEIVEIACSWRGVGWLHQGNSKETGADCEGFVEGVFREAGFIEVEEIVHNWRRREDGSLMLTLLQSNLDFVAGSSEREPIDMSGALPADILAFCDPALREPNIPRHLGIYTGKRHDNVHYIIHMGDEQRGIVEHRLDQRWLRRAHSIWRPRGVDG